MISLKEITTIATDLISNSSAVAIFAALIVLAAAATIRKAYKAATR